MTEGTIKQETLAGTDKMFHHQILIYTSICFAIDLTGRQPTVRLSRKQDIDMLYFSNWNTYKLNDGVLYKSAAINGEQHDRLFFPDSVKDVVFAAAHHDLVIKGRPDYIVDQFLE